MKKICLVFLVLAGCATESGYKKAMDSWVGSSTSELLEKWGYPHGSFDKDGMKILIYSYARTAIIPGTPEATVAPMAMNLNCTTWVETRGDKVTAITWKGNDCKQ